MVVNVPTAYPTNLTSDVTIVMQPTATTGTLQVTVKDSSNRTVPNAAVVVTGGPGAVLLTGTTNASGVVSFTVPSGTTPVYTITMAPQLGYGAATATKPGPPRHRHGYHHAHGGAAVKRLRDSAGFTLVEVLVATSILAVVMLIAYNTLNGGVKHAADVQSRAQIEADVRVVADAFVRDFRQAYSGDPTGTLTRVASGMNATTVTFYSPDRATPYHLRKISYRLNGTTLERAVTVSSDTDGYPWTFGATGAWVPVLKDVRSNPVFTYQEQDGEPDHGSDVALERDAQPQGRP